ncbi:MnhB domain-containing protein [Devosia sp. 63-57]|uniref:MnhB domain-containing protein n=1 Tax=Devosia sp. 63-57 TaxID=1895751 RepID=UPI00086DEE98|nr:MnhB domain-containing protein [Devosia sp. 63-57]ODT47425.1 MAG: Na(+)/H(+) antiporter subunit B [Pelagibacterium sp. SCN 63-126]ODU87101.1 MAG: Na(+)/H(+) antiporter subunit B [Pelagibacterium sp. SCN 63-17]OJX42867.1 MAG: Na(+)/H(+) antiporter subunit B [Devosia sp. 63-57]
MNTVIFRTLAPVIVATMLVFSVYVCLRGHNEPGGGFIGGLIGAASIGVLGMAWGAEAAKRALKIDPMVLAGCGVVLAGASGLLSVFIGAPFMTSIWLYLDLGETVLPISTPLFFDLGVYLVVFGTLSAIALALEGDDGEEIP